MSTVSPNKYQKNIIDWVKKETGNALIEARAGCGKTTTLELVAEELSKQNRKMTFITFNKHLQEELEMKISLQDFVKKKSEGGRGTLKVFTVNSLGNSCVLQDLRDRGFFTGKNLDDNKMYPIIKDILRNYCATRHYPVTEDMINEMAREIKTVCNKTRAKYKTDRKEMAQQVIEEDRLCLFWLIKREDGLVYPELPWAQIAEEAMTESLKQYEEKGIYDYAEQIYIPVKKGLYFPAWMRTYSNFIGIDEAQDLSALQLDLLKRYSKMDKFNPTSFLFVGDRFQAIYAFAGADCHSIDNIIKQFNPKIMPLNENKRCAKAIIEEARLIVPDIEASPDAEEGEKYIINNSEIAKLVQPNDLVIARKNKDLAEVFLQIVLEGKPVYIKDKEMVDNAIRSIACLGCSTIEGLQTKIYELQREFKKMMKNPETQRQASAINNSKMDIYDMIENILEFFINKKNHSLSTPVNVFIEFFKDLFITEREKDAVIVSSIHQVKGLDADRVFIINYNLMPCITPLMTEDEKQQEVNLQYIAMTRAKKVLYRCYGGEEIETPTEDEDDYEDDDEVEVITTIL